MENFTVEMRIANLTGGEFIVVDALVGTGSSLTALPGSLLRHLGVEEKCLRRFKLAGRSSGGVSRRAGKSKTSRSGRHCHGGICPG